MFSWQDNWRRIGVALDGPLTDSELAVVLLQLQSALMLLADRVDVRIDQCVAAPDDPMD